MNPSMYCHNSATSAHLQAIAPNWLLAKEAGHEGMLRPRCTDFAVDAATRCKELSATDLTSDALGSHLFWVLCLGVCYGDGEDPSDLSCRITVLQRGLLASCLAISPPWIFTKIRTDAAPRSPFNLLISRLQHECERLHLQLSIN